MLGPPKPRCLDQPIAVAQRLVNRCRDTLRQPLRTTTAALLAPNRLKEGKTRAGRSSSIAEHGLGR
jgi:hypothetical protein